MRFSMKLLATAAFAALAIPATLAHAAAVAIPATTDPTAVSSSIDFAGAIAPLPSGSLPSLFVAAPSMDTPTAYPRHHDYEPPRVELFVGYSYIRAIPVENANRLVWLNGGSTSLAINFNRYLGFVADFGGFADTQLRLSGVNAPNVVDSDGNLFTYLFGPRLSFRGHGRVTPFVQALFGVAHASQVTYKKGCTGPGCTPLPIETEFAMTAGGGLDYRINRHFALRLIQAEYMMTDWKNRATNKTEMQNDMRLSTGIVFRFGGHNGPPAPPPPTLTYSCSVNPSAAFPGDRIAVTGAAADLNTSSTAVYTWTADGGTVAGTSNTATIDTTGLAPGSYTLKGHVAEGTSAIENADCTALYQIRAFEPPTVSCSANPTAILVGGTSTITSIGVSPQNRPLTYSFTSTSGSVIGNGPSASFSSTDASAGASTITCKVADDLGQAATATTTVSITLPAVVAPTAVSELCTVSFERDHSRPVRVDNEGKACLDGIALTIQRTSDAKLALIGNASTTEKGGTKLAAERAINTRAYLVNEKGIDAARVTIYTGNQNTKTVTNILVPTGATLDAATYTPIK